MGDQRVNYDMGWLRQLAGDARITPFAVRVAVALTRYFHLPAGTFPSHATLASRAVGKPAGVRTALRNLQDAGYLEIKRRGRRLANTYAQRLPQGSDGCDDNGHLNGDGCDDNGHLNGDGCDDNGHLNGDGCDDNGVSVVGTTPNPLTEPFKKEGRRTAFADQASATAALTEAAGLAEDDAAILRAFRFDPAAQTLYANTQTALITIRSRTGEVASKLGLRLRGDAATR